MNASSSRGEEKEAVSALLADWAAAFAGTEPEPILACYAEDAVLQGTFSAALRQTPEAIRDYFEPFYQLVWRGVEFHRQLVRVYGDTAACSGTYTFTWEKAGRNEAVAARFSFTCVKRAGRWQIVDHHSSVLPT